MDLRNPELFNHLAIIIILGIFVSSLIIIAGKWGWLDWYEYNKRKWMPERCEFCLAFWLSLFLILLVGERNLDSIIITTLCSAVISRKLI